MPSFTKESEEYPSRIAGQKYEVGGDSRRLMAIFDSPVHVCSSFFKNGHKRLSICIAIICLSIRLSVLRMSHCPYS